MLQATESDTPEINHDGDNLETGALSADEEDPPELRSDKENTMMAKLATLGNTCCGLTVTSLCACLFLYGINIVAFVLLVWIGDMLRRFDEDWGDNKKLFRHEEQREVVLFTLATITLTILNLVTLYFFCKRTEPSRRLSKAGIAVFGCCKQRRVYDEAVVPYKEIFQQLWAGFKAGICEMSSVTLKVCIFSLFGIVFVLYFGEYGRAPGEGAMLVVLLPIAAGLWLFVWKIASQGDFFQEEEMASVVESSSTGEAK